MREFFLISGVLERFGDRGRFQEFIYARLSSISLGQMSAQTITCREAFSDDLGWLWELKRATMRDYAAAVFGWDDEVQRRMFEEKFDPSRIRVIQIDPACEEHAVKTLMYGLTRRKVWGGMVKVKYAF